MCDICKDEFVTNNDIYYENDFVEFCHNHAPKCHLCNNKARCAVETANTQLDAGIVDGIYGTDKVYDLCEKCFIVWREDYVFKCNGCGDNYALYTMYGGIIHKYCIKCHTILDYPYIDIKEPCTN